MISTNARTTFTTKLKKESSFHKKNHTLRAAPRQPPPTVRFLFCDTTNATPHHFLKVFLSQQPSFLPALCTKTREKPNSKQSTNSLNTRPPFEPHNNAAAFHNDAHRHERPASNNTTTNETKTNKKKKKHALFTKPKKKLSKKR
ncbi:hypothetical protein D6783_00455 [Candidatus Woesearchaeota archaeon]|nr:MAG: hypothetical protein D6783_00455 [Candidatus Woesearchaeota archaeon]